MNPKFHITNPNNFTKVASLSQERFKRTTNYEKYIDPEGTEMFNALMEHKTSQLQMNMVSNRLKRLEFEEQRARERIAKARERILKLNQQREEKQKYQEFKQKHLNYLDWDLQRQKRVNSLNRLNTKENIKHKQRYIVQQNRESLLRIKEMVQKGIEERDKLIDLDIEEKQKNAKKEPKVQKIERKDTYKQKINHVKAQAFANYQVMKDMEQREKELLGMFLIDKVLKIFNRKT